MNLNGWQRLWCVFSVICFGLASSYVVMKFPRPSDIPHSYELCKQLKPESQGKISCARWQDDPLVSTKPVRSESQTDLQALWDVAQPRSKANPTNGPAGVTNAEPILNGKTPFDPSTARLIGFSDLVPTWNRAANGYTISFVMKLPAEEMKAIAAEYSDLLQATANRARINLVLHTFVGWLLSCLIVYGLGWSAGWVYQGFRRPN